MARTFVAQRHAFFLHRRRAQAGYDVVVQQGGQVQLLGFELHRVMRGHACLPVKGGQVIGHRSNGVGAAAKQVNPAVAIEVHRVLAPA